MNLAISFEDVQSAARQISGVANRTPVFTSRKFNALAGTEVFFKCENMQRVGAFKFRGAYNALSRLTPGQKARGVVTHSSGNHAQGVALAAALLGISAVVVMPDDAPVSKVAATRDYGAEIITYNRQAQSREEVSAQLMAERDLVFVPPYDHPHIMAGQGTAALELLRDVPDLDILIGPIGGGGLLSGCTIAAKGINPNIRIFGVETQTSNDWYQSFQAGTRIKIPPPDTIADGMRTQQPGELTFPVIQTFVEEILLVSDNQVVDTLVFLLTRLKILVEPTGAVAPAVLFHQILNLPGQKVGVLISGGNIDPSLLGQLLRG
jgi:threonine dehydratase